MKLFGLKLFEGVNESEVTKENSNLKRTVAFLNQEIGQLRPQLGLMGQHSVHNIYIPYFPLQFISLYHMAHHSDVIKTIMVALRREAFRRGFDKEPKFVKKCANELCAREYQKDVETCTKCKHPTFPPDQKQLERFERWEKKCNGNNQGILDVYGTMEDDVNIIDDEWMLFIKEYTHSPIDGSVIGGKLLEIVRINPVFMDFVADRAGRLGYDEKGNPIYICPNHRTKQNPVEGRCSDCGSHLYRAKYVYMGYGSGAVKTYYLDGEVYHSSRYTPSLLHGFPPMMAIWQKAVTLMNQDKYQKDYYGKQRAPKGILLVNTRDLKMLDKAWNWLLDQASKYPHIVWPLGVPSQSTRGQVGQFINFMNNLQEMQYTEAREEMRRSIGALYGVMPIFQADMSQGSGLNNEGLEITVTNRAIEMNQKPYNDKFTPAILEVLNITHWDIKLAPSEERDEMSELQREQLKIANAQGMLDMGFSVILDDDGEFQFSGEAKQQEPFGSDSTFPQPDTNASISAGGSPMPVKKSFEEKYYDKNLPMFEEILIEKQNQEEREEAETKLNIDLKEELSQLTDQFVEAIKGDTESHIRKVYNTSIKELEKELDQNIEITQIDENTIQSIKRSKVFVDAFEGIRKDMEARIVEILKTPDQNIIPKIKEQMALAEGRLQKIAGTETIKIINAARKNGYAKVDDGSFRFVWDGPNDKVTTKTCLSIKRRSQEGVTMDELIQIIQEESNKEFPEWTVNKEAPAGHYECRHIVTKL